MNININIIGMGYVGLTFALFASNKFKVTGVESNMITLKDLSECKTSIHEPFIRQLLTKSIKSGSLVLSRHIKVENNLKNIFIVTPGTPINSKKEIILDGVVNIVKSIAKVANSNDLVIVRSTVKLGTTDKLEKFLNKKNINVCFCPERTIEGNAINELKNLPQIIGANTNKAYLAAKSFFSFFGIKTLDRVSAKEAELSKLMCNSERDLYFALSNEIAMFCEKQKINAYNVINASTSGYGRSNLKLPGTVGGPCLEKDPYILINSDKSFKFSIIGKSRYVNESLIKNSVKRISKALIKKNIVPRKIAILGCAFKGTPPTADLRGSLFYPLWKQIRNKYKNAEIVVHDFLSNEVNKQDETIQALSNLDCVIDNSDLIILQNNHPRYSKFKWNKKLSSNNNFLIYDFWNQLKYIDNNNYMVLGNGDE